MKENLTQEEKIKLLDEAKEAYYNTGEEIMSDLEYDELEEDLGLKNKNYIGAKQGNYEIKHTFLMGSLDKTQVKENNGELNIETCVNDINSHLGKSKKIVHCYETTPKLDGASFSAEFKNKNGKASLISVSTRGNGNWGSDIKHWFEPILKTEYWSMIDDAVNALCKVNSNDIFCVRGEVLIKQSVFTEKYADQYANPRAFVAGMLGIKYSDATEEKKEQGKDLHFVCYDYRFVEDGKNYVQLSWMNPMSSSYRIIGSFLNHIGELPDSKWCQVHNTDFVNKEELLSIYYDYLNYRKNICDYALDGIVFKPSCEDRLYGPERSHPEDCIALKFAPMINSSKIVSIEWNIKKTGEYFPTAIIEPIVMPDGKTITRASLHNYGWIVNNECGIGSKVKISLAGDIIPFVYDIEEHCSIENNIDLPEDGEVKIDENSKSMHYMKIFTEDEFQKNKFLSSCISLNINNVGPATANDLYDALHNEIEDLSNIVYLMNEDAYNLIYTHFGTGKSIKNIVESLKKYVSQITLVDIIKSFNFKQCGNKAAEVCARIISGLPYSTTSLPAEAYQWALNTNSREYYLVDKITNELNAVMPSDEDENNDSKVMVILTGSPEKFGYKTKGAFIQAHPDLKETTSWKEINILVTDDINSNSGKMQKAKKLGIEIKTYGDFDGIKPNIEKPSTPSSKQATTELF